MGEGGFQFLDILLLGAIAAFIGLRLRAVLGQRTGHQQQRRRSPAEAAAEEAARNDNVVSLPRRDDAEAEAQADAGPQAAGLAQIRAADPSFDADEFLQGAKAAYEMIVSAFAAGDKNALRPLLSREVFADFERVIDDRARQGHKQDFTFVGIKAAEIAEAQVNNRIAEVTIRFQSELISATRDAEGKIVAGDPSAVDQVTDVWTFARDTRSRDPNWTLIATSAPG